MKFGICGDLNQSLDIARAGFEYIEPGVVGTLRPEEPDADVLPALHSAATLTGPPIYAFNLFLPADLKVIGERLDQPRIERYVRTAFDRASAVGARVIVLGSGNARRIPDGWARGDAERQFAELLLICRSVAERVGVDLAIEALNVGECNFVNSVAEAAAFARACGGPRVGVVSDLYHIIMDGQSYDETYEARDVLKHVHIAGDVGRRAPASDDLDLLRGYFSMLKRAEYDALISVEGIWESIAAQGAAVHSVMTQAWADA